VVVVDVVVVVVGVVVVVVVDVGVVVVVVVVLVVDVVVVVVVLVVVDVVVVDVTVVLVVVVVVVVRVVLVVVDVGVVVVVVVASVVVVVVDPQERFAGRQSRITSSESTLDFVLRAQASTLSAWRPGRSGPNAPRCVATATGTNAPPQDDFVRSSPAARSANRGGATWIRLRPFCGGRQMGRAGSVWLRQRRTSNSQNPLPQTPS